MTKINLEGIFQSVSVKQCAAAVINARLKQQDGEPLPYGIEIDLMKALQPAELAAATNFVVAYDHARKRWGLDIERIFFGIRFAIFYWETSDMKVFANPDDYVVPRPIYKSQIEGYMYELFMYEELIPTFERELNCGAQIFSEKERLQHQDHFEKTRLFISLYNSRIKEEIGTDEAFKIFGFDVKQHELHKEIIRSLINEAVEVANALHGKKAQEYWDSIGGVS